MGTTFGVTESLASQIETRRDRIASIHTERDCRQKRSYTERIIPQHSLKGTKVKENSHKIRETNNVKRKGHAPLADNILILLSLKRFGYHQPRAT